MKLPQSENFKAAAEAGKISMAAKKLYISPPVLSISIAGLEKDPGETLYNRTCNHSALNEQDRIFLHYVNQLFEDLDCAKLKMQESLQKT